MFFSEHSVYYKIYSLDITVGENDFLLLLSEKNVFRINADNNFAMHVQ